MGDDDMCFLAWHASVASDILGICFVLACPPAFAREERHKRTLAMAELRRKGSL